MNNQLLKIVGIAVVLIGVLFLGANWLVGDNNQSFGGSRFPNGLSADSTAPSAGEVRGTTLTITGASSLSGALSLLSNLTVSGGSTVVDEFTQGGGVTTIDQQSGSVTLTEANLLNANVITFTASSTQAALTATLPATSTMTTLLPNAGDYRQWVIENPFTGAATTTTIAAGTGVDLQEPDGQNVVIGINNYGFLTCFREASTDVVCRVDETIPAD